MMYRLIKKLAVGACMLGYLTTVSGSEEEGSSQLLINDEEKGGWRAFGHGIQDSAFSRDSKEFLLDLNWSKSTWGVGCMYTLDQPLKDKKLQEIRVKVKSEFGSKAKVRAGIATMDDANLVYDPNAAIEVGSKWQEIVFPVSKMVFDMPNPDSRAFTRDQHPNTQIIKFLFAKPTNIKLATDKIYLRNPQLIFESNAISENRDDSVSK